jgi:hypothetical protein
MLFDLDASVPNTFASFNQVWLELSSYTRPLPLSIRAEYELALDKRNNIIIIFLSYQNKLIRLSFKCIIFCDKAVFFLNIKLLCELHENVKNQNSSLGFEPSDTIPNKRLACKNFI